MQITAWLTVLPGLAVIAGWHFSVLEPVRVRPDGGQCKVGFVLRAS